MHFHTRHCVFFILATVVAIIICFNIAFQPLIILAPKIAHQPKKLILTWTEIWDKNSPTSTHFNMCPELREICDITDDKRRYDQADAVVFHPVNQMNMGLLPSRSRHQRHVLLMWESPSTQTWYLDSKLRGFFNWTMTYRMDSDVPYPYYYLAPNSSANSDSNHGDGFDQSGINATVLNKTKSVVWFVSNCHSASKRERYVAELQKYISVEIYGHCGVKDCSRMIGYVHPKTRNTLSPPCEEELLNKVFKFYIAFENSVCRDYVTEKFYKRWRFNSVPIVLSRRIVEEILPPNSFIAVDDFPEGPRQLAQYLKYLMVNHTEYLKYFQWKTNYYETYRHPVTNMQWGFCGLCEKLWQTNGNESKVYDRIDEWWAGDRVCDNGMVDRFLQ